MNCSVCGKPDDLECPACDKAFCISCFVDHGKACYEQKQEKTCVHCGADEFNDLHECHDCHKWVCEHHWHKHKADHLYTQQQAQTWHWCAGCNRAKQQDANKSGSPFWQCPTCHEYYCEACTMRHTHVYARANFAGRFNVDNFTIHGVDFKIDPDFIKESLKTAERVRQEQEAKQKAEEEARRRKEEEFQREKARLNEEFFRRFFGGSYTSFSSSSTELQQAFSVLQLSTRATVQEVKHAFKRKAKEAHPDVGGSEEAFKKLNNAYELALAHAKRNER